MQNRRMRRTSHRIGQKKSTYDFLQGKITFLVDTGKQIFNLEMDRPMKTYSAKEPDKRWWMVIKECVINQYIGAYLHILNAQRRKNSMKLYYLDLTASNGLCQIRGKPNYYFPGSALLAAMRNRYDNHFDKLFLCDLKNNNRQILRQRLENLNSILPNQINYEICDGKRVGNVDSNEIVDSILQQMKEESNRFFNALVVCDNAGFNIQFETLEKIHNAHPFTDFIINLPIKMLKRQWGSLKDRSSMDTAFARFCGFPPDSVAKDQIAPKYIENLKRIGKSHVEAVDVRGGPSAGNFHYYMLFAVRNTSGQSSWMSLIQKLRERFANVTGDRIKEFFNIFFGPQQTLI